MNSLEWLVTKAWVLFLRIVGVILLILAFVVFVVAQGQWEEQTLRWLTASWYVGGGLGCAFLAQSVKGKK